MCLSLLAIQTLGYKQFYASLRKSIQIANTWAMIEWTPKTYIGFAMGLLCTVALTACLLTCIAVFNLAIIQRQAYLEVHICLSRKSPVYVISLANICSDIVWISMYFVFLVPSIILDGWIWPGKRGELFSNVIGFIINNCWYGTSFLQILMAVNRMVVICFSKTNIFTYKVLRFLAPFLLVPCATIHTFIQQELLPCCRMSLDPSRLGYGFETLPNVTNYSNVYLAFPTNLITSATAIFCYTVILVYVHRHSAGLQSTNKKRSELTYAIQFFAISMFHLLAWTSVRFLPSIIQSNIRTGAENFFSISAFMIILDASSNSYVYLAFNREVRAVLSRRRFFSLRVSTSVNTITVSQTHSDKN